MAAFETIHLTVVPSEDYVSGDHQGTLRTTSDSDMRQLAGRSLQVGQPVSGVPTWKSSRPPTRPGSIWRPLLIEQEAQADPPIVSVVAPSGVRSEERRVRDEVYC